jgi:hypothetical protein
MPCRAESERAVDLLSTRGTSFSTPAKPSRDLRGVLMRRTFMATDSAVDQESKAAQPTASARRSAA